MRRFSRSGYIKYRCAVDIKTDHLHSFRCCAPIALQTSSPLVPSASTCTLPPGVCVPRHTRAAHAQAPRKQAGFRALQSSTPSSQRSQAVRPTKRTACPPRLCCSSGCRLALRCAIARVQVGRIRRCARRAPRRAARPQYPRARPPPAPGPLLPWRQTGPRF